MTRRIIFYYQTFTDLSPVLYSQTPVTHIHLSAIHFGTNPDKSPYIHLNNHPPDDPCFDPMWEQIKTAAGLGIKVVLMVGGAGSAYTVLFSDFETYYPLLVDTIRQHPDIGGIDLDVEEEVTLPHLRMLIDRIDLDFDEDFILSMAPVQGSLQNNMPGLGGFCYNVLYQTAEGQRINYFNGQFYSDYSSEAYHQAVSNGYPASKVVMGMMAGQDLSNALQVVVQLVKDFSDFGGAFVWEYFDASKAWSKDMKKAMTS